jgi:hypothetical protein
MPAKLPRGVDIIPRTNNRRCSRAFPNVSFLAFMRLRLGMLFTSVDSPIHVLSCDFHIIPFPFPSPSPSPGVFFFFFFLFHF